MIDAISFANAFMELARTQGAGIAALAIIVWAWLNDKVISKNNHDTIVSLYKERIRLGDEQAERLWQALESVIPATDRAADIASKALERSNLSPRRPTK